MDTHHPLETHSSSTEYLSSPAPGSLSRPITSCLSCRHRKVKCDRRQPQCLKCERGGYACSYVSKQESNRITKPSSTSGSTISSSTLARINPGLQRLASFMAQAKAYEESSAHGPLSLSLDTFLPTSATRPTSAADSSGVHNPRSEEDALILENGVPHFVSGKHWAWMAAEVRLTACGSQKWQDKERKTNTNLNPPMPSLFSSSMTFNQSSRNLKDASPQLGHLTKLYGIPILL